MAVSHILSSPEQQGQKGALFIDARSEPRAVAGTQIDYWTASGLAVNVLADNAKLGGGGFSVTVGGNEVMLDKERFNRNVQEILRGDQRTFRVWGIAIDINLESEDEGQVAGIFIMFTVVGAVVIVGLSLRSYWATALTGAGLAILMIWLKGIGLLVGIKGGLVVDLIVPIAMVSLGVDFAIHAVRRYREECALGFAPRRALAIGMAGVLSALVLALFSDSIAFLSNTAAGIEAVVHFGIAAAIAVGSSFIVLGVGLPLALMHLDLVAAPVQGPATRLDRVQKIAGSAGVAALAGTAVILLIAVSAPLGVAMVAALIGTMIVIPYVVLVRRRGDAADQDDVLPVAGPTAGQAPASPTGRAVEILARLAEFRLVTLPVAAAITAVAAVLALRLEATFDARDFFDGSSDFVVSLDKFDERLGPSMGEPVIVFVEGDLSDPDAVGAVRSLLGRFQQNALLARRSDGPVVLPEPHLISLLEDITAGDSARAQVMDATGVTVTDDNEDGIPDSRDQIKAVLDFAVENGVPGTASVSAYAPEHVLMALSHDPAGRRPDAAVLTVYAPGTREQSVVVAVREALEDDMSVLAGVPAITRTGLTGSPMARDKQLQSTVDSMQVSIPIAAAGAFVLLLLAMRSLRFAIVTIIPIGLVVAWLYGLMYVSGFALNFVTATIGAVSIGVGIDYSIHMTERFREERRRNPTNYQALRRALDGTGVALAASAFSSIVGFGIMGFAPMPMFSTYGILTAIMISLALAASLLVLPSLLLLVTPEPESGDPS